MTILLGEIALTRLQQVEADEPRQLVELKVPGSTGSVFQDLGRSSSRLWLVGVFLGEDSLRDIEVLRDAHANASPLPFSGDIAVGSDITDVIIEHFEVHQARGHAFRYEYRLRIREWAEPPRSAAEELAVVDAEIETDADQWAAEGQQLAAGLTDPAALADTLDSNPGLLARIDVTELATAVLGALGGLDPSDFAHLLASISNVDPDTVIELIEALGEADSLDDLLAIVSEDGINLLEELTGIDLDEVSPIVQAFLGGSDFLQRAREVVDAARELFDALASFNPGRALDQLGAVETSA